MQISIPIPLTKYTLNIDSTYTNGDGAVYDGLDCCFSKITAKSAKFNTKIVKAWISGAPNSTDEDIEFSARIRTESGIHSTPIFSGKIMSVYSTNPDPSLYETLYFTSIVNQDQSIDITWDGSASGSIKLPLKSIEVSVIYTKSGNRISTSKSIPLPNITANPADITKETAKIEAEDFVYGSTKFNLYKEGIKTYTETLVLGKVITFSHLEVDKEYLLELDYSDGRTNLIKFTPREACMWVKIDGTYKKGMVWFKTLGVWKRAKGIFCRKSTADNWKKGG